LPWKRNHRGGAGVRRGSHEGEGQGPRSWALGCHVARLLLEFGSVDAWVCLTVKIGSFFERVKIGSNLLYT
jgi:hypothetical protein